MFRKAERIHFVGIGGIGMSGIAEVLCNLGYAVSGSDLTESEITKRLTSLGVRCFYGHRAEQVADVDVVVVSSAVTPDNVEVVAAKARKIPVIPRAEMLAELMRMKYGVAVAGSHGKTTTTSLIATVLAKGGLDPTMVIGGRLNSLGYNAKLGQGEFMVAEADESDGSFLRLNPMVAVVTTIDREHLDYYKELEDIQAAFAQFLDKVPFYGFCIVCADEPNIRAIVPRLSKRVLTYGLRGDADYAAREVRVEGFGSEFLVMRRGQEVGPIALSIPGWHNIQNALAAVATGLELDIPFKRIQEALHEFTGIQRRFELKGQAGGVIVIDDYGHHPTEIEATLRTARLVWPHKRLVVAFQPHRYTRTQALWQEFCPPLLRTDILLLTEIYAAGEPPLPGVSGAMIHEGVRALGHPRAIFIPRKEELASHLLGLIEAGDVVLTLGAGDVWKVGEQVLAALGKGEAA
ncbi:MAG TPA: UDP-N-acetylmuramate--L-alanine ligase [Alphaproteobacteria bacterium]|nr:UDP-N-acetylmuramate--L-alanine ligase [Alphaproteobacteria bacterium]